jgi:hypothetical protein
LPATPGPPPPQPIPDASTYTSGSSQNGHRRRRRSSRRDPGRFQHLQRWLYRKYNLTLETAAFLIVVFGMILYTIWWVMGEVEF